MKRGIRVTSCDSSSLSHDPLHSLLNGGILTPFSLSMNANATATSHLCFDLKPSPINMVWISKEDSLIRNISVILRSDGEQEDQRLWCRAALTCEPVISGMVEDDVELQT
ncbi:unnamed protein product [Vicia faba]|uniref:Ig-like domain-containing protein n=1 Tax=Vicia faba TaxID=3906 RepID=A0AAV1AWR8_VICFA|nr:unnamed protein product [Vicia faba]